MVAARAAGVLGPISGFRSAKSQDHLFFDIKAARGQGAKNEPPLAPPWL